MNKKQKIIFPDNFLWGAATSAHQVEGGNLNNWSRWEGENMEALTVRAKKEWQDKNTHNNYSATGDEKKTLMEKFPEMLSPENYISGRACDHYNRYEEDFNIAKKLNHNAHRFSIEWSRIEPEEGVFNQDEIDHYREVLQSLRDKDIEPLVVLWHWTNPVWLADQGAELNEKFAFYFARYVKTIVKNLGDLSNFWLTLNEPNTMVAESYMNGNHPPQKKSIFAASKALRNLAQAHNEAYEDIHEIQPEARVGFSNLSTFFEPQNKRNIFDKISTKIINHIGNREFLNLTKENNDFLAVQYYRRQSVRFPMKRDSFNCNLKNKSDMDWEIYPEGIYHILLKLRSCGLPIYITENGLADADDSRREKFIKSHLYWINKAIKDGVDVRGYFYWSLLDNFEWDKGFWPRFGLVEINYKTLERKIRPSAWKYADICRDNKVKS